MFRKLFNLWRPTAVEYPDKDGQYLVTEYRPGACRIIHIRKWDGKLRKWRDRVTGEMVIYDVVAWKKLPKTF